MFTKSFLNKCQKLYKIKVHDVHYKSLFAFPFVLALKRLLLGVW